MVWPFQSQVGKITHISLKFTLLKYNIFWTTLKAVPYSFLFFLGVCYSIGIAEKENASKNLSLSLKNKIYCGYARVQKMKKCYAYPFIYMYSVKRNLQASHSPNCKLLNRLLVKIMYLAETQYVRSDRELTIGWGTFPSQLHAYSDPWQKNKRIV